MKRIIGPARCAYINIIPNGQRRFDLPMQFELLLDGQPVRKLYRLYGGIASQRIELTDRTHTITLRLPDGTVLQRMVIPAAPYNYLCTMDEQQGFTLTAFGPMRPTPDCDCLHKLARLLTAKLTRLLTADSPICLLYKQLEERTLDHMWFEFWDTALIIHFMPESGHVPDLRSNFDSTEAYAPVIGTQRLTVAQTLALEAQVTEALAASDAAEAVDFYYNEEGFFCARLK